MTKPYESPFKMRSITTAATMKKEIATEMKVTAAVKKREEWMSDGNKWDTITPGRVPPTGIKYMVVDVETHDIGRMVVVLVMAALLKLHGWYLIVI